MNPIVQAFRNDFERFFGLQKQQIAACPDEVWLQKTTGFPFWLEQLHSIYFVGVYTLPQDAPEPACRFSRKVLMFSEEPEGSMSKDELLELAGDMERAAHAFMDSLLDADLPKQHPRMSRVLGRECTNQQALVGLIRHCCYHLGCCDAALRAHGLPGVY